MLSESAENILAVAIMSVNLPNWGLPDQHAAYFVDASRSGLLVGYVTMDVTDTDIVALLQQATALNPDRWDYWFRLGVMAAEVHDLDLATQALELAKELNPEPKAMYDWHLAAGYALAGFVEEARTLLERAQEQDASLPILEQALADPAALSDLELRKTRIAPVAEMDDLYLDTLDLAFKAILKGDLDGPEKDLEALKEQYSGFPTVYAALAEVYLKKGNALKKANAAGSETYYHKAIEAGETCKSLGEPNDILHYTLARAYHNQGHYRKAIEAGKEAARRDPSYAPYRGHIGLSYLRWAQEALAKDNDLGSARERVNHSVGELDMALSTSLPPDTRSWLMAKRKEAEEYRLQLDKRIGCLGRLLGRR